MEFHQQFSLDYQGVSGVVWQRNFSAYFGKILSRQDLWVLCGYSCQWQDRNENLCVEKCAVYMKIPWGSKEENIISVEVEEREVTL